MDNEPAQRQAYGKSGDKMGKSKSEGSKDLEMLKAGGANANGSGGPTGSSRSYPKGKGGGVGSVDFCAPIKKGQRTATDWAVGGVG